VRRVWLGITRKCKLDAIHTVVVALQGQWLCDTPAQRWDDLVVARSREGGDCCESAERDRTARPADVLVSECVRALRVRFSSPCWSISMTQERPRRLPEKGTTCPSPQNPEISQNACAPCQYIPVPPQTSFGWCCVMFDLVLPRYEGRVNTIRQAPSLLPGHPPSYPPPCAFPPKSWRGRQRPVRDVARVAHAGVLSGVQIRASGARRELFLGSFWNVEIGDVG